MWSLPLRGAWIEILNCNVAIADEMRRSPYGERGLKSSQSKNRRTASQSLPLRGAWIEILAGSIHFFGAWSLPLRGAWIEIGGGSAARRSPGRSPYGERGLKYAVRGVPLDVLASLPLRGAWIEMPGARDTPSGPAVAPLTGSVD